jgi:hypothetical protein
MTILGALLVAACSGGTSEGDWKIRSEGSGAAVTASAQKTSQDGVGYIALTCAHDAPLTLLIAAPVDVGPVGRRDPQPHTVQYRVDGGAEKTAEVQVIEDLLNFDGEPLATLLGDIATASRLDLTTETVNGANVAMAFDLTGLAEARAEVEQECRG